MRTLLALVLVCGSAFAQSGTITVPSSLTNHSAPLAFPAPDPGNAHISITTTATFAHTVQVDTDIPFPFQVSAQFADKFELKKSGAVLHDDATRITVLVAADWGTTYGSGTVTITSTVVLPIADVPDAIRFAVRSHVTADVPPGGYAYQLGSSAGGTVSYAYVP